MKTGQSTQKQEGEITRTERKQTTKQGSKTIQKWRTTARHNNGSSKRKNDRHEKEELGNRGRRRMRKRRRRRRRHTNIKRKRAKDTKKTDNVRNDKETYQ